MKYLLFSAWGLGDLVLISPSINGFFNFIKKKNKNNLLSVIVKGEVEKKIAKELLDENITIISLNNVLAKKKKFKALSLLIYLIKLKIYSYNYVIIPPFFTKKIFLYFSILSLFFKFKVIFEKLDGHRRDTFRKLIENKFKFKIILKNEVNLIRKKNLFNSKNKKNIIIFPGSDPSQIWKRYKLDYFLKLGSLLKTNKYNFSFLIGPSEMDLKEKIPFKKKISKNFNDLRKILSDAKVLISGDTGVAHLASLISNINIISVIGPTNHEATKPGFSSVKIIRSHLKLDCMPCINTNLWGNCDKNIKCLTSISPEKIFRSILK